MTKSSMTGIPHIEMESSCCCEIRTASLTIGYSSLFLSLMSIFHFSIKLLPSDRILSLRMIELFPFCFIFYGFLFAKIFIAYLLIRGITKEKPNLMFPWIYVNYVGLIVLTLLFIIVTFIKLIFIFTKEAWIGSFLVFIILGIIVIGFFVYAFLTVVAHCQKLLSIQTDELEQRLIQTNSP